MTAQILRDAAKVLRERAEAVTAHNGGKDLWFEADIDLRIAIRTQFPGNAKSAREDAKWIEVMTPTVGLALADWLDKEADEIPEWATHYGHGEKAVPLSEAPAVGVARAILGGDA